jgi:uncharacterized protein (TIGR00251 family)
LCATGVQRWLNSGLAYSWGVTARPTSLRLRVLPGATRSEIVGRHGDAWKVRVTARPEGGKANDAVLTLVADALRVPRRDVELASGQTSRDKTIRLVGLTPDTANERMADAAGGNT